MKCISGLPLLVMGLCLSSTWSVLAQERIELKGTSISGNLELPNAETDVPWAATRSMKQKSGSIIMFSGHVLGKKYTPINQSIFKRQIEQFESDN